MAKKYLDDTGLGHLWDKIKAAFLGKADTAYKAASIPFGEIDTGSTSTVLTATVPGVTELREGVCFWVENNVVTSSSGFTLNVNELGAKPCFSNLSGERSETGLTKNRTVLLVYSETVTDGGGWYCYYGYYTSNTDTLAYMIRRNNGTYKSKTSCGRYKILFTVDEDYLLPTTTVANSTATTKELTTLSFDPFGEIYYYSYTTTIAADGTFSVVRLYNQYHAVDLRQSFNTGTTLTAHKAVYVVADMQSDGMAKLASNPISQSLPTTDDGHIYIYLGRAYDTYRIQLDLNHPVYRYVNGALREISSDSLTVNGHTVNSDVPANAKFTDTVPNGFGTVQIGTTEISASSEEDTFNLIEGTNIELVPQNGGVVINASGGDAQINKIFTAYSTTAAGTAAKVATLEDATGFSLAAGVRVAVRFQYGNSAATPTLNVNNSGAKNIAYPTSATAVATGSGTTYNRWGPYETVLFTYNGSQWVKDSTGLMAYAAYNAALNSMHWENEINLSGATQSDVDDLAYELATAIYYVWNASVGFPESAGVLKVFNDNEEYTHWEFISDSSGNEYARTFSLADGDWVNSWKTLGAPFDIFKIKTYTYAYSDIASNGSLNVTATNLGMSTPTGYTPLAAQQVSSGNGNVAARTWDVTATGSTAAVALRNLTTTTQSGTVTFKVVYVNTNAIGS